MRGSGPAAGTAGILALAWVATELWHLFWLQDFNAGIAGVFVIPWTGPGVGEASEAGFFTFVGLPLLLALPVWGLTLVMTRVRGGPVALGLGVAALGIWTALAGLIGLGVVLERLALPIFATGFQFTYDWSPWSRWIFDGITLVSIALLAGFGPNTPVARRALWIGVLAVLADSAWRVCVALFSGQIPLLYQGIGVGDWVFIPPMGHTTSLTQLLVWGVFAGLAALFVAVFANLPAATGPTRVLVGIGLGTAGLWLGLQGALLYTAGLLVAMGSDAVVLHATPEYPGMLAALRFVLVGIGALSLAIAVRRMPEPAPEG